ncbi:Stf0 family sulfotransferase [Mesorhizobium sp. ORM6]
MKGVAILTEARSGSEWLGSLTNSTGLFGKSAEWLDTANLGRKPKSFDELMSAVIDCGGTANGRFAVKLFPRHLHWSQAKYGADFLAECLRRHAMGLVLLERRDRLRQAISYCRAKASGRWRSTMAGAGLVPQYDFAGICQAYFLIEQSYAFWEAYLRMANLPYDHLFYEDLLDDPVLTWRRWPGSCRLKCRTASSRRIYGCSGTPIPRIGRSGSKTMSSPRARWHISPKRSRREISTTSPGSFSKSRCELARLRRD